jgi:hypothetical protein
LEGVRGVVRADNLEDEDRPKGRRIVFTKGNRLYFLCGLASVAGILASLGGGWFDGS